MERTRTGEDFTKAYTFFYKKTDFKTNISFITNNIIILIKDLSTSNIPRIPFPYQKINFVPNIK